MRVYEPPTALPTEAPAVIAIFPPAAPPVSVIAPPFPPEPVAEPPLAVKDIPPPAAPSFAAAVPPVIDTAPPDPPLLDPSPPVPPESVKIPPAPPVFPPPSSETATNNPAPYFMLRHWLLAAGVLAVHVIPSGDVITRLPAVELHTPALIPQATAVKRLLPS